MRSKEELLDRLSHCVVDMEDEEVAGIAQEYIDAGYPASVSYTHLTAGLFTNRQEKGRRDPAYGIANIFIL